MSTVERRLQRLRKETLIGFLLYLVDTLPSLSEDETKKWLDSLDESERFNTAKQEGKMYVH